MTCETNIWIQALAMTTFIAEKVGHRIDRFARSMIICTTLEQVMLRYDGEPSEYINGMQIRYDSHRCHVRRHGTISLMEAKSKIRVLYCDSGNTMHISLRRLNCQRIAYMRSLRIVGDPEEFQAPQLDSPATSGGQLMEDL